jgi:hypothetical protein
MKLTKDQELEYLKMENSQMKEQLSLYNKYNLVQLEKDLKVMITIATKMRHLLIECRQQFLPFDLGKKIDSVLRDANELD